MLAFYKNGVQGLVQMQQLEEDCWINLCAPTEEELAQVE